jgi:hypothetical protein
LNYYNFEDTKNNRLSDTTAIFLAQIAGYIAKIFFFMGQKFFSVSFAHYCVLLEAI